MSTSQYIRFTAGAGGNTFSSIVLTGAVAGTFTQRAASTTTSYSVTWPSAQGSGALTNDGAGNLTWVPTGGSGTVTSVALTVPSFLSVAGSPITTSGTLAISLSGTALPIANGGTGQTTAAAAFGALSPLTTKGDLLAFSSSNARLAVGSDGQILTADSTQTTGVKWAAAGASGVTTVGTFSGSSQTNGASISTTTITFGPADATNPGMVAASGAQTLNATITLPQILTVSNATASTTTGTGAVVITGGLGVGAGLFTAGTTSLTGGAFQLNTSVKTAAMNTAGATNTLLTLFSAANLVTAGNHEVFGINNEPDFAGASNGYAVTTYSGGALHSSNLTMFQYYSETPVITSGTLTNYCAYGGVSPTTPTNNVFLMDVPAGTGLTAVTFPTGNFFVYQQSTFASSFNGVVANRDATDSSSTSTGSINTAGGIGVAKKAFFGSTINTTLTASRAVVTDGSSNLSVATTTATEIGFVNGVTSAIQTQLNAKAATAGPTFTGTVTVAKLVETPVALTDGATVALDASLGNTFTLSTTTNPTILATTNATDGQKMSIRIFASGGSRTVTLTTGSSQSFSFGSTITALAATASGTYDWIGCIYNGASSRWNVVGYVQGY